MEILDKRDIDDRMDGMGDNLVIGTGGGLSAGRRIAAQQYVAKALCEASKLAVEFQKALLEDEGADPALRFKASEAVLDRFLGKAAQEIRVEDNTARPIVFSDKLAVLRAGMHAAVDAATKEMGVEETFERVVTSHLVDEEGITITE